MDKDGVSFTSYIYKNRFTYFPRLFYSTFMINLKVYVPIPVFYVDKQ